MHQPRSIKDKTAQGFHIPRKHKGVGGVDVVNDMNPPTSTLERRHRNQALQNGVDLLGERMVEGKNMAAVLLQQFLVALHTHLELLRVGEAVETPATGHLESIG